VRLNWIELCRESVEGDTLYHHYRVLFSCEIRPYDVNLLVIRLLPVGTNW